MLLIKNFMNIVKFYMPANQNNLKTISLMYLLMLVHLNKVLQVLHNMLHLVQVQKKLIIVQL